MVKYHAIFLLLAYEARIKARAVVVAETPFGFMIQFEKAVPPVQILFRSLIENELGHEVALARQNKFVHFTSQVEVPTDSVHLVQMARLHQHLLLL